LGLVVCFAQQTFGIISMGMQSAIMDAYPIKVELMDTVYTVLLIILIAFVSSVRPAIKASNEVNTGMLQ
jgi:lipoprotein-releasing system permease protein